MLPAGHNRHAGPAMTRQDLEDIQSGGIPLTRSVALVLVDTLLAVWDAASDEQPAKDWGEHKLAYKTAKQLIIVRIRERNLP